MCPGALIVSQETAVSSSSITPSSSSLASSSSAAGCQCTCDNCGSIILTGGGANTNSTHSSCYFAGSGNDKFRINDPCTSVKINGKEVTGTHGETELKNYGISALDGGYYIEIKHCGSTWCQYQISQARATNPCASTAPSSSSATPASSASSGGNCHAPTGCSTVITTEDFQWDGRCYFFTSISWLNNQISGNFQINGGGNYNGYVGSWSLPAKIDGGYYVKTNDNSGRCCGKDGTMGNPTCE